MGNASGKKESDNVYTSEELRFLETAYRNASGGALEKLTSDRLVVRSRCISLCVCVCVLGRCTCCSSTKINAILLQSRSQVQGLLQFTVMRLLNGSTNTNTHVIHTHDICTHARTRVNAIVIRQQRRRYQRYCSHFALITGGNVCPICLPCAFALCFCLFCAFV